MWSVTRIDEADYGCEERMPGEPLLVLVTIESDDGRMCRFECAENWLLQQGIDEGDEWPEDIEQVEADREQIDRMSEWMNKYYEAVEEMEDLFDAERISKRRKTEKRGLTMQIMNATEEDKDELLALYHAMIGGPCEWSETYPDENTIAFDLKNEDLFVMKNDAGEIIATISIDHDDAVESLTCWHEDQAPSGELSRLCVRKDMQGQGIAKQMMNYAGDVLKNRGMKGIHILVREGHVVALSTYAKIGFRTVGECDLFDKHFICMEKKF